MLSLMPLFFASSLSLPQEPLFFGTGAIIVATLFMLALAPLRFAASCCAVVGVGGAVGAGAGTVVWCWCHHC